MYTVKTDENFFKKFKLLELRLKELSFIFQNNLTEVSRLEIEEWNTIAAKLQYDLCKLVTECNVRFIREKE